VEVLVLNRMAAPLSQDGWFSGSFETSSHVALITVLLHEAGSRLFPHMTALFI
jgi:hypothetical protein